MPPNHLSMLEASSRPYPETASDISPNRNIPPLRSILSPTVQILDFLGPHPFNLRTYSTRRQPANQTNRMNEEAPPSPLRRSPTEGIGSNQCSRLIANVGLGKAQPLTRACTGIEELIPSNGDRETDTWKLNARHAPMSISKAPLSVLAVASATSKNTNAHRNATAINIQSQAVSHRGMLITHQRIPGCLLRYFLHPATRWSLRCIDNSLPETTAWLREHK